MVARRIIAVSPDAAFATQLERALAATEAGVEIHPTLDAVAAADQVSVSVIHFPHDVALAGLARLAPECRVIAILPRANLMALVDVMRSSERIAALMVAEDFDARALAALASRLLDGNSFGLEPILEPDTQVQAFTCEYEDRRRCSATIHQFIVKAGIARKHHAAIEQSVDEMLMNALYDAPVRPDGTHVFAGVPVRTRVRLKLAQPVFVQYAFDGRRFAVAVRDAFGSLDRQTVLRVLHKCLHAEQKIDRKAGGAGVGLYLMLSAATAVYFSVVPGVATEVTCVFAVDVPEPRLTRFAFVQDRPETAAAVEHPPIAASALRPVEMSRPGQLARTVALGAGLAALAAVLALVVWPRVFGRERPATTPPPPVLAIDTDPTGAAVVLEGKELGHTPLELTTLTPGTQVTLVLKRKGYRDANASIEVPARGARAELVQPLARSEDFVQVRITSDPAGAQVIDLSEQQTSAARTYTPAELFVEAGKEQRFMLTMPGRIPVLLDPFTAARGTGTVEKTATLVRGATVRVEAQDNGTVTFDGAPHCRTLSVPAECTLGPGVYTLDYVNGRGAKATRTVQLGDRDLTVTF